MEFKDFNELLMSRVCEITAGKKYLFVTDADPDEIIPVKQNKELEDKSLEEPQAELEALK